MSAAESIRAARELLDSGDTYQENRAQVFALLAIAEALTEAGPADAIRTAPANYQTWRCLLCGHSWHSPHQPDKCPQCWCDEPVPWSELVQGSWSPTVPASEGTHGKRRGRS